MKKETMGQIIEKYTAGKASLNDTNAALKAAGAGFHLDPTQHTFTPADLLATKAPSAAEANGWGLLDTGTGSLEKVRVIEGKLPHAVNEVRPDGSVNMLAYVIIAGKTFPVKGDTLTEA